jgi:hypothetical protein
VTETLRKIQQWQNWKKTNKEVFYNSMGQDSVADIARAAGWVV